MIERLLSPLSFAAAIGCGIIGGVFFAFSVFVMKAFGQLPPAQGIAAMQTINVVIIRTLFMPVFMVTALICLATAILAAMKWGQPGATALLVGSVLYFVGTFLATIVFNVPLNDQLAAVEPNSAAGAEVWTRYLADWTLWNHVRTVAALAGMVCFILGLLNKG